MQANNVQRRGTARRSGKFHLEGEMQEKLQEMGTGRSHLTRGQIRCATVQASLQAEKGEEPFSSGVPRRNQLGRRLGLAL